LGQGPARSGQQREPQGQEQHMTGKGMQRTAFGLLMLLILYVWLNGG
jgi:hypothetical protein